MSSDLTDFLKRVFLVVGVALLPVLIWYLFDLILMAFGAVVFATLLWLGAEPFMRWLSIREGIALLFSAMLILIVLVTIGLLFGSRIENELQDVIQRVNSSAAGLQSYFETSELGKLVAGHVAESNFSLTAILASVLTVSSNLIEGIAISLIAGIYLSTQPRLYRDHLPRACLAGAADFAHHGEVG